LNIYSRRTIVLIRIQAVRFKGKKLEHIYYFNNQEDIKK